MTENTEKVKIEVLNFIYKKTDFTYKGYPVYYRKLIDISLRKINRPNDFDDKHNYYYISPYSKQQTFLGKYIGTSMRTTNIRSADYDYHVYEFINDKNENSNISIYEHNNIYCIGIPDSSENMIIIADMFYNEYQCFMNMNMNI